jgi:hypothetical protein
MSDLSTCTKTRRWTHKAPSARVYWGKNPTVGCGGQGSNPRRSGRPQPPLTNQASIWFTPVRPPSPVSGLWDYVVGPSLHHGGIVAVPITTTGGPSRGKSTHGPVLRVHHPELQVGQQAPWQGGADQHQAHHVPMLHAGWEPVGFDSWKQSLFQPIIHVNSANRQVNQLILTHP